MAAQSSSAAMRIAQIAVETSLMHLDKVFDYKIPDDLASAVQVGSRVRVRFAGSLVNGWVLGIADHTKHTGSVLPIQRVIGDVPPLTASTTALIRAVADRYAGTFTDVLRSAVPTRHAATEAVMLGDTALTPPELASPVTTGAGQPRRVAWVVPAGTGHWSAIAGRLLAALPRGPVIAVLPDATDVAALNAELKRQAPDEPVAVLTADVGPSRRWRAFLAARLGRTRVVIGTRSAVFAPLAGLGTVLVWDDGDDSHREQHAPYWHVREVAVARSGEEGCDLILAGRCITVEAAALVARKWLTIEQEDRASRAQQSAKVRASADDSDASVREIATSTRIPPAAMAAVRDGLRRGSVLLSVPGRGYVPVIACAACREVAKCPSCAGHLRVVRQGASAQCARCGWNQWRGCPKCGHQHLRAVRIGDERTADEIGRAFPQVPVVVSNADKRVTAVPRRSSIVVATHGCEPFTGLAYAAVVVLDAIHVINRPFMNAESDALRRFANAIALAAPGAPAVVVAGNSVPVVQALVRGDVAGWARRELEQRNSVHLPPATLMVAISGSPVAVHEFIDELNLPQPFSVFGPVPHGVSTEEGTPSVRGLVVVPRGTGRDTMARIREVLRIRSARKAPHVRVVVDPNDV